MENKPFIPIIKEEELNATAQNPAALVALLTTPLHEALTAAGSFAWLDGLAVPQKMLLTLDYVQMQVLQGGFIQLIQNGYTPLLLPLVESLQTLGIGENLVRILDQALQIYVRHHDILDRETTVAQFGKLYEEFREFEEPDKAFEEQYPVLLEQIAAAARTNMQMFASVL